MTLGNQRQSKTQLTRYSIGTSPFSAWTNVQEDSLSGGWDTAFEARELYLKDAAREECVHPRDTILLQPAGLRGKGHRNVLTSFLRGGFENRQA